MWLIDYTGAKHSKIIDENSNDYVIVANADLYDVLEQLNQPEQNKKK